MADETTIQPLPTTPPPVVGGLPVFPWVTQYTPVIPKLYWDVYSAEERMKWLCMEYDRILHYLTDVAKHINDTDVENAKKFATIDTHLKALDNITDELREECDKLAADLEGVHTQLDTIETHLTQLDDLTDELVKNLQALKEDVNNKYETLEKEINDKTSAIQKDLNDKYGEVTERIDTNVTHLKALDKLTNQLSDALETITAQLPVYNPSNGKYETSQKTNRDIYRELAVFGARVDQMASLTASEAAEHTNLEMAVIGNYTIFHNTEPRVTPVYKTNE